MGGTVTAQTKQDDVTLSTIEYTFSCVTTTKQYTINGEPTGLSWVRGDTTDPAFSASGWFLQVQTPDTASATIDALEMSSIVPAANATGVSVSATAVLTFNNKIKAENVFLVNSPDGAIVTATKSWDSTHKILTLTPSAALQSGDRHAVVIANVTDIYGQAFTDTVRYFTTA